MSNSQQKMTRSERRAQAKRQKQMQSIGIMILGVLIIAAAVIVISFIQPGVQLAEERDFSLENMNGLGDPNAPVVIEIYSSFACIYCKNFTEETEGQIIDTYVNTGQVYLVYRSFNNNPADQYGIAGQAAYCAGDQGKFWEMHDTIFANFSGTGYTNSQLTSIAKEIGLDRGAFSDCLSSGKYAESVQSDFEAGIALGITGTPSFSINGVLAIEGFREFDAFVEQIESALASASN